MKSGVCPKCGAAEVYTGPAGFASSAGFAQNSLSVGFMAHVRVASYVCAGCGYLEQYVEDASGLDRVTEKFVKVEGRPSA